MSRGHDNEFPGYIKGDECDCLGNYWLLKRSSCKIIKFPKKGTHYNTEYYPCVYVFWGQPVCMCVLHCESLLSLAGLKNSLLKPCKCTANVLM